MNIKFIKTLFLLFISSITFSSFFFIDHVDAYVKVKGYYRKDGTYVRPHVRSDPNGLKYDNYSWTPSQGLYNSSYGSGGYEWNTPTWITDPNYYEGKALYESGGSGIIFDNEKNKVNVPANASLNYSGSGWVCNSGYYKSGNACVKN